MKAKVGLILLGTTGLLLYGCGKAEESVSQESRQVSIQESSQSETTEKQTSQEKRAANQSLLESVEKDDLTQVKKTLQATNYQIDDVDPAGNTALNVAVHNNQIEIAIELIDHGADINLQNSMRDSPYLYAAAEGRTEILAHMLTNSEPNLTVLNRYGGSGLIPAAEKGHIENVKLLLEDGREAVDFQNNFGYTALIEAVALNDGSKLYQDISKLLLEHGANKNVKDSSGHSTVDYAKNYKYKELSELLANY